MIFTQIGSTLTSSNAATSSITSGIDSTYDEYMILGTAINVATDEAIFRFQFNASSQSGYNETITSTYFSNKHAEVDTDEGVGYNDGYDQHQATAFQTIFNEAGSGSSENGVIVLNIYSPSSTTYVTHFIATGMQHNAARYAEQSFVAGYINTTAAITDVQFKASTGNHDGVFQLFGIS